MQIECLLSNRILRNANVRFSHVNAVSLDVIKTLVHIDPGSLHFPFKLDCFEWRPRGILLRQIFTCRLCRKGEDASRTFEYMNLHA